MDIKDFILIGGGLLIAAVVAHGFWIAWRARRDPLRLDLVKTLPPEYDEGDDLVRLRAELPNGGARVVARREPPGQARREPPGQARREPPEQTTLPLQPDDAAAPAAAPAPAGPLPERDAPRRPAARRTEPRLNTTSTVSAPPVPEPEPTGESAAAAAGEPAEPPKVKDVIMPERPIKAEEPKEPRRHAARKAVGEPVGKPVGEPAGESADGPTAESAESAGRSVARQAARTLNRLADRARGGSAEAGPGKGGSARSTRGRNGGGAAAEGRKTEQPVEELIVINVIAPRGKPFVGSGVVEGLRGRGLRYGEMNIFHRVDPMTRSVLYSVANVVEPGTFDLSDLDNYRSPGVCFFMQLPGPEQPMETFEDMLKVARDLAMRLGGELKDEQRSVMTGQTVEHYRQRIADFCRRRMSMRA